MSESTQFSQSLRGWMDTFVHRSMRDSARFVKASGFSMPQFFLLMHLRHHEHCGISDLSEHMEISNAAASQLVDKLVHAELLVRTEDPDDRRAKLVALSPKGEKLLERGIEERYRWVEELEGSLTAEEKEKIADALEIMTQVAKKLEVMERL
jgi:DNA-binding MarR family transcriptional regulator